MIQEAFVKRWGKDFLKYFIYDLQILRIKTLKWGLGPRVASSLSRWMAGVEIHFGNLQCQLSCLAWLPNLCCSSYLWCRTATAKSLQSCPALCDPIDGSPPGSSISGILQARTLEWVAISFSYAWKWKMKMKVKPLSRVRLLFSTPWTAAYQAPPSMGFSRQEYWSRLPLLSPTINYNCVK